MDIKDYFMASTQLVNSIAEDIILNGCSKEVIDHASKYAQLENEYGTYWRINLAGAYAYVDIDKRGRPTGQISWNNADMGCDGMDYKKTMKHLSEMTESELYDTEEGSYFSESEADGKIHSYTEFKSDEQKTDIDSKIESAIKRVNESISDKEEYVIVTFNEYIPGSHTVTYSDMGGMPSSYQTDTKAIDVNIRLSVHKDYKEKAEALLEEAWYNAVLDSFENSPLDKDYGGEYSFEELYDMPVQEYMLKYLDAKCFSYKNLDEHHVKPQKVGMKKEYQI